jgi:hypothetical protein
MATEQELNRKLENTTKNLEAIFEHFRFDEAPWHAYYIMNKMVKSPELYEDFIQEPRWRTTLYVCLEHVVPEFVKSSSFSFYFFVLLKKNV